MTRGGTKGGRVYVKTDRAGSDAKTPKLPAPSSADSVAKSSSNVPATKSEVVRSGGSSLGNSNGSASNSSTEVGRGPKDIGSGKSAGARGANQLPSPPKATTSAPTPGFAGVLSRLAGLSRLAAPASAAAMVMEPTALNAGEDEWLAANKNKPVATSAPAAPPSDPSRVPTRTPTRPAPAPIRKDAPAPARVGLSVDDKVAQLVAKGFSKADATNLANAKSSKVDAPSGYAKGGMVKAKAPKIGKSLYSAAVPKVPAFGKDLGKPAKTAAADKPSGMPRMPKMPATGKAAMTNKMAAITKPKAPAFAKGGAVKTMPKGKC